MKEWILGIATLVFANISPAGTMGENIAADPWNGLYFGINGGGGIASDAVNQNTTYRSTAFSQTNPLLNTRSRYSLTGGEFGGQVGYNLQHDSWLIGAEGDMNWASLSVSPNDYCAPSVSLQFFNKGGNGFGHCLMNQPKINNLGTIRGRIGYIVNNVLWYATGGGAWSSVKSTFTSPAETTVPGSFSDAQSQGLFLANSGSFSATHSAWTVGGGVEAPLWGHFSAKAEYLYVNYGRIHNVFPLTVNPAYPTDYTAGSAAFVDTLSSMSSNIIRVGINYKV